jgi:putative transcriptional regulator
MTKFGDDLIEALGEMLADQRGDPVDLKTHHVQVPETVDVRAIRGHLKMNRKRFATRFGLDERAVQEWEQGRRRPDRTARVLLKVIERHPEAVDDSLAA